MMEFKFTPLEPFTWVREYPDGSSKLIGSYVPGAVYNCTRGARHDALREQCATWLKEGKIQVFPLAPDVQFVTKEVQ